MRYTYGVSPTDYAYTGQKAEAALGLYFYNARWYDPSLGRFAQPDTLIPEQTQGVQAWDRYAYVNNNPLRYQVCRPRRDVVTFRCSVEAKGIASPILRDYPQFLGRGRTTGGAREWVIPDWPLEDLPIWDI